MEHSLPELLLSLNRAANVPHGPLPDKLIADGTSPTAEGASEANSLTKCVQRAIMRLAPGRIRDLKVELRNNTLVLSGSCSSFYCKQVAQHAAMDLARGAHQVENGISVDE